MKGIMNALVYVTPCISCLTKFKGVHRGNKNKMKIMSRKICTSISLAHPNISIASKHNYIPKIFPFCTF